jgi:uncharacterized protein YggT (Ycf19 family)
MRTIVDSRDAIVVSSSRIATVNRIARVIDYLFGLLYSVLLVRLALEFFSARRTSGFYQFIQSISDPFYAPFKGIVASHTVDGAPIVWPLLVAVLGYMLLHAAIRGLLRLVAGG